ncbi:MAG: Response regulatory protein [Dehalococcoidales bacterium]|nr:Response regulatory protein [Dehalococcoidales bacterium]
MRVASAVATEKEEARVVIASEHPQVQYFLRELIEGVGQAVVVAQAPNATTALAVTRNLRPDIVIIDCYLPHVIGMDHIALSRVGGLDVAETISEEMPKTRVVLLNNMDTVAPLDRRFIPDANSVYSIESMGTKLTFIPTEVAYDKVVSSPIIFADIMVRNHVQPKSVPLKFSDKMILLGGVGIIAGWLLVLTIMLAPVGLALVLVGGLTLSFTLVTRLANSWWRRWRQPKSPAGRIRGT